MSEHYFSSNPTSGERAEHEVDIRGLTHTVFTASGVFSAHRLDKATAILLNRAPFDEIDSPARVLDVGCGWGPISLALADAFPDTDLWATDVNEQARALTLDNLTRAGHSGHVVTPEEAFARIAPGTVDLIMSNPPIRVGKKALHALLLDNLALLAPQGRAWLVVSKNLGADSLATWLDSKGYPCTRISSTQGFRILDVRTSATAREA